MSKKIKTTHLSLNKFTGKMIYVTIDIFKFLYDEDTFYLTVELENQGQFEFFQEIDLPEGELITDHKDLERFALNWIFDNVEIVKEEVACAK